MLKPLLVATATIFSATFVLLNTDLAANAATQSHPVQNGHQELIARGNKPSHISAQKQADIKSIYGVLTEVYRGFNNQNIEAIQSLELKPSSSEKVYLQRLFKRFAAMRADVSYEAKSIELINLTKHTALIKINQLTTITGMGRSGNALQETTVTLVKYQGKWKIGDSDDVIKSINKYQ
jgi:hypothetical protein